MSKKTQIDVTYTGADGKTEIVNMSQDYPEPQEIELELEPQPKPKAIAVEDGAYEVSTEEPEEKKETLKERETPAPDDLEYKDRTKRRIDQLLAKQMEAQQRERLLLAEMEKLKSNLTEMSQVKTDYEVSAISERKGALSVAQKALSSQAAEALSSGDYAEFQKIDNDLKRIMIDLHQIEQAENRLKNYKEESSPLSRSSSSSSSPYHEVPEKSLEREPQRPMTFMDALAAGDASPRHVLHLEQQFESLYDSLPSHEQKWVDDRRQLFDLTTVDGQRRMASVLGTAAHLQNTLGADHPDYFKELDNRLIRKNLLKPDSFEHSPKKPSRTQPVMTEPSARAPKKPNTVKLNSYEVEAARALIGSKGIETEEDALRTYVKNKLKFEQSIQNL